jgi:hypothetical protein
MAVTTFITLAPDLGVGAELAGEAHLGRRCDVNLIFTNFYDAAKKINPSCSILQGFIKIYGK